MEFFCINNFRYTTLPWLCQLFTVSKATDMPKSKESLFFCQTFAQHPSIICTRVLKVLLMKHYSSSVSVSIVSTRLPKNFLRAPPLPKWPCLCEEAAENATLTQKLWNRVDLEEVHQCADREHSPSLFHGHPLRLSVLSPRQRTHFSSFLQPRFKSLEELIVQTFISILDSLPYLLQPSKYCNPQSHKLPLTCPSSWAL